MATYYVKADATGAADGSSLADAWTDCSQVTGVTNGDTVYFYATDSTPASVIRGAELAITANNLTLARHPSSPARPVIQTDVRTRYTDWTAIGNGVFTATLPAGVANVSQVLFNYGASTNADGLPFGHMRKASSAGAVVANGNGTWFYDGESEHPGSPQDATRLLTIGIPSAAGSGSYPTDQTGDLLYSYVTSIAGTRAVVRVTGSGLVAQGLEFRLGLNRGNAAGYGLWNENASGATITDCRAIDCGNHGLAAINVQGAVTFQSCFTAGGWQVASGEGWIGFINYTNVADVAAAIRLTDCRALCSMTVGPDGSTMVFKDTTEAAAGTIVDPPGGFYVHSGAGQVWSNVEYRRCVSEGWGAVKMLDGGFISGNPDRTLISDRLDSTLYPIRCYDCKTLNGNDLYIGMNQAYVRHTFDLRRAKNFLPPLLTAFTVGGNLVRGCMRLEAATGNNYYALFESCAIVADITGTTFANTNAVTMLFAVRTYISGPTGQVQPNLILRGCTLRLNKGAGAYPTAHHFIGTQDTAATHTTPTIDIEQCVFDSDDTDTYLLLVDTCRSTFLANQLRARNNWFGPCLSKYAYGTQASPNNHYLDYDTAAEWQSTVDTSGHGVYATDPQLADPANGDLRPSPKGALQIIHSPEKYQQGANPSGMGGRPYNGRYGCYQPSGGAALNRSRSKARRSG